MPSTPEGASDWSGVFQSYRPLRLAGDRNYYSMSTWPFRKQLVLLTLLAVQNTVLLALLKRARTQVPPFHAGAGVLIVELLKVAVCTLMELRRFRFSIWQTLSARIFSDPTTANYALPALLYTAQNHLCIYAVGRLPALEYQVVYQGKILTTAFFAWTMLGRRFSAAQWVSLAMLTVGVALVSLPAGQPRGGAMHIDGLVAVAAASLTSGYAGIYLERSAKGRTSAGTPYKRRVVDRTVASQSLQLAAFAVPLAALSLLTRPPTAAELTALLTPSCAALFAVQAASGLLVGAVIRHSDNVLKGFATSASIALSACLGARVPGRTVLAGAGLVATAVMLFAACPPAVVRRFEKISSCNS